MKNEYKITKDLIMSWAKEYHLFGTANIVLFALWCIMGTCGIVGLIFAIVCSEWLSVYFFSLLTFITVYKLFFQRFVIWNKRYKIYSRMYGVSEWTRSYEFTEDCIVLTDHTSVSRLQYENIIKINEKDNVVMILCKDNIAARLYKDTFVEGSWDECKELLLKKAKLK